MTGRRLVLLRHGQTSWNESGRAQGHADIELDARGHEQAAVVASYLSSLDPSALWSSDLARARQTCAYVEKECGLVAGYDERLREFDVGDRRGMTIPEFAEAFPGAHSAWLGGEEMPTVAGAEVTADVEARIVPALRDCLASLGPGETGIVVTHGASLKVGLIGLLGWPTSLSVELRGVDNCAWATVEELDHAGRLRMAGYNERVRPDFA